MTLPGDRDTLLAGLFDLSLVWTFEKLCVVKNSPFRGAIDNLTSTTTGRTVSPVFGVPGRVGSDSRRRTTEAAGDPNPELRSSLEDRPRQHPSLRPSLPGPPGTESDKRTLRPKVVSGEFCQGKVT